MMRKHKYLATSWRAFPDEIDNEWYTDRVYGVGDTFTDSDGMVWRVTKVFY